MTRIRRWPASLPLRVKLVAAVTLIALAGLAVAGVATVTQLRSYLVGRIDNDLVALAQSPLARGEPGEPAGGPGAYGGPAGLSNICIAQYSGATGRLIHPIRGSNTSALPVVPASLTVATFNRLYGHPYTVGAAQGSGNWRVLLSTDQTGPLMVGESLDGVDSTVNRLVLLEVGIGLAVLVLMAGSGLFLVRRSLRPLAQVETTAAAIAAGDLSQRVPAADERTEVGRVAGALNVMLGRIEASFASQQASEQQARASEDRMRRFVADASHELRTPLTSIRGFAELHRMGAVTDDEETTRLMSRIESESTRMGGLVDDLLTLARLDESRPLAADPVDLVAITGDAVTGARLVAPDREITMTAPAAAVVTGDAERLRQVVGNLLSNALRHTPPATPVSVDITASKSEVVLQVADRGPGIPPEHIDHVFERFYRTDSARSRAGGGTGLGLAIVAEIVAAHDGTVTVSNRPGSGATFTVRLPSVTDR